MRFLLNYLTTVKQRTYIKHILGYTRCLIFWRNSYPKRKFVIFGQGRTGSTLLLDLINNNPQVLADGEIFNVDLVGKIKFPNLYLKSCLNKAKVLKKSCYGFRLKFTDLKNDQDIPEQADYLRKLYNEGWKVVFLERENSLRLAISDLMVTRTNKYHIRDSNTAIPKIMIDPAELLDQIRIREDYKKMEKEYLKDVQYLHIIYESDLLDSMNHQICADKIFEFLGVDSIKVSTKLSKTTTTQLSDTIKNYNEVEDVILNSNFKHFW